MLTLKELKGMVNLAEDNGRVPTAKQLIESGEEIIVKEVFDQETTISVYANGFVLYRSEKHYTVFPISDCGNYEYEWVKGSPRKYGSSFFDNENWYVRLIMEAEDRLAVNQEKIKSNHKVYSYDRMVESGIEIESDEEDILESLVRNEFVKEMLGTLNERQREMMVLFYFEQWKQKDIAKYLDISQQGVSSMIRRMVKDLAEYAQEKN